MFRCLECRVSNGVVHGSGRRATSEKLLPECVKQLLRSLLIDLTLIREWQPWTTDDDLFEFLRNIVPIGEPSG